MGLWRTQANEDSPMTAVFGAASVSERVLFITPTRFLTVPRFAGSSNGPEQRHFRNKQFFARGWLILTCGILYF